MRYSGYELLWMFAVYSVAGWCLEVCAAAAKQKKICQQRLFKRTLLSGLRIDVCGLWDCSAGT